VKGVRRSAAPASLQSTSDPYFAQIGARIGTKYILPSEVLNTLTSAGFASQVGNHPTSMNWRAKTKEIGPSAQDFEVAVVELFADYPDALLIVPSYLEVEAHDKIKVCSPTATRLAMARAIRRMVKREQLWPLRIAGAEFDNGVDAFIDRDQINVFRCP
jgi:hypothetical protein